MPMQHRSIQTVQTFDALLHYLEDELDWPINEMDVHDLTFDYKPEELGLNPKIAAKIKSIKQLRPLTSSQPFGIFFIEFEPKRLPVTVLRRILGSLVTKKRASANQSDRRSWNQDDLIFVSAFGELDTRRIDFAHFADDAQNGLPTLRVLGWDQQDTERKIDWVDHQLHTSLSWNDGEPVDEWRRRWRSAFVLRNREVITTSKALAQRLAELAQAIRKRVRGVLAVESDTGPIRKLHKAFQDSLIHDLDDDAFADMYAQTIAYGLLSARMSRPAGLVADDAALMIPNTNPFLRDLMEEFLRIGGRDKKAASGAGIDFDELGVNDVVELLRDANIEAVIADFGRTRPGEDPVIHFYEDFMRIYDKKQKVSRGVFYTPQPVVSFIVRSVDEILRDEFALPLGLADTATWGEMAERHEDLKIPKDVSPDTPFVQILDPATGTGTFLVEVIDLIHKRMRDHWLSEGHMPLEIDTLWNEYVPEHLLPRLYGYELLMAPYTIAHMKIGLKLADTGYTFQSEQRLRVFLTNSLEPPMDLSEMLEFVAPFLAHEARAANKIKRDQRFTVVIGNPPYLGEAGAGGEWIAGLMRGRDTITGRKTANYFAVDGQPLKERNSKWINDDYVKFIRFSQWKLENTGCGILGFISNHSYLDNPTFRGVRWSLMESFDEICVLDLHGNLKKKETPPEGGRDVNVFDIQQGVGIGLFVTKSPTTRDVSRSAVRQADLWGARASKYDWLMTHNITQTEWTEVDATEPFYLFEPFDQSEAGDYFSWPVISDIMPTNGVGIVTARDHIVIDFDRQPIIDRVMEFRNSELSDEAVCRTLRIPLKKGWNYSRARHDLKRVADMEKYLLHILYRPFDTRHFFYHGSLVWRTVDQIMGHMLAGENIALLAKRQGKRTPYTYFYSSNMICESCVFESAYANNSVFPLYLYSNADKSYPFMFSTRSKGKSVRRPNLDPGFIEAIGSVVGLEFISDGRGDLKKTFGPEDVLAYIYAIFHSPEYRRRFEPMLKLDFPRVPPPAQAEPFRSLIPLGHDLLALHLLESPLLDNTIATYTGPANPSVEKVSYTPEDQTVWLDKAQTRGFVGVPEAVWNFQIGGYQVCHKWLKDRQKKGGKNPRPGRILTGEDLTHYQRIVVALHETIRLMAEIDEVIESHGGWPGAFVTEKAS